LTPLVSVVVPIYNVELYLRDCLSSLAAQTLRGIEVVLVDDGSTDDSVAIAREFCARDSRFLLVQQPNTGLGHARNTGVGHATGDYLAFADSDDVVARHAYELLLSTLETTGSDFATAGVRRLSKAGARPSGLHAKALTRQRLQTHITKRHELFYDTAVWNKLFRRSFWDGQGLRFPEGVQYEDIPVMIPAHFLARSVDVLIEPVYYWRERQQGDLSITQRRMELSNFADRMAAVTSVDRFLSSTQPPRFKRMHDEKLVGLDLLIYLNIFHRADDDYRKQFLKLINDYLDGVDHRVYDKVPAIDRLKYHLLRRGLTAELLEVLRFQDTRLPLTPPVRGFRRWYGDYPFRLDRDLKIPKSVYELRDELALESRVDDVYWAGGRLHVVGHAYVNQIDLPSSASSQKRVFLRQRRGVRRHPLPVEDVARPDVTAGSRQPIHSYDWSGYSVTVDPALLLAAGNRSSWQLDIEVRSGGVRRTGRLGRPTRGRAQRPPYLDLDDGRRITPSLDKSHQLNINVGAPQAVVTGMQATGEAVLIEGVLRGEGREGTVELRRREGTTTLSYPASFEPRADGGTGFQALIAVAEVLAEYEVADVVAHSEQLGSGVEWDLFLVPAPQTRGVRLALAGTVAELTVAFSDRETVLRPTREGNLTLYERSLRPVVTAAEWTDDGRLVVRGRYADPTPGRLELVLRRLNSAELYAFPATRDGHSFAAELTPANVPTLGGGLPLASGSWELMGRRLLAGSPADLVAAKIHPLAFDSLPPPVSFRRMAFTLRTVSYDSLVLTVAADLRGDERGQYNDHRLKTRVYPALCREPLTDAVLFSSWGGKQYSDSPRAIYEELLRRGDDREHVWIFRDVIPDLPGDPTVVQRGSREYFEAAARARHVVSNDAMPPWFGRRAGQRYLQTWHGTPLKRIGFDIERIQFATLNYLELFADEVANWSFLVSPNRFSTEIFRRAFRYDGEVLETGYPRNDLLFAPDGEAAAAGVRTRLGLPPDRKIVLYAPTWRDNDFYARGRYRFNLQLDLDRAYDVLGADHVLLIRGHNLIADTVTWGDGNDFVRNVSAYPDISDLYLVADILVTDYSSVMFDFANTRRPMLFFAYDLEAYRDTLRGLYLDFEEWAPGPVLRTSEDLLSALRTAEDDRDRYADRYARFLERFCALEDGSAAARVVDSVFGG